jgi:hypothetical protein
MWNTFIVAIAEFTTHAFFPVACGNAQMHSNEDRATMKNSNMKASSLK